MLVHHKYSGAGDVIEPKFVIEAGPALQSKRAGGSDHTGGQTLEWLEVGPTARPKSPAT